MESATHTGWSTTSADEDLLDCHVNQQGFPSRLEAATAKVFSNEMAVEVTNAALQIFGGYGYSKEYPMEWLVRFARGWTIAGGTAQIQRNNIAAELLKGRDSRP